MARLLVNKEILLFGDVGDPFGWGDGFTAAEVAEALAELGGSAVTVRLNSGGGIAFEGMAIYSVLRSYAGEVTITIDGVAASAASLIAMAGKVRTIRTGAMIMIHDPAGVTRGTSATHRKSADNLDKLAEQYAQVYANAAGMKAADVREMMLAETWLDAKDAVGKGFATGLIEEAASETAAFDYRIYAHAPKGFPMRVREKDVSMATAINIPAHEAALARMRMRLASLG